MTDFNHILNWKLKAGSHEFPGSDGGTCINEAAIVAAGFEYKKISSANDCPPCFSRPISIYAIYLNDRMPDDIRNELLMPFVTQLAGTADTKEVEAKRAEFMIVQIGRRLIAKNLTALGLPSEAFAKAETFDDVRNAALDRALDLARARALTRALDLALDRDLDRDLDFWKGAVAILDETILMGRHPDQIDHGLVIARMNKIREIA